MKIKGIYMIVEADKGVSIEKYAQELIVERAKTNIDIYAIFNDIPFIITKDATVDGIVHGYFERCR